MAGWLTNGMTAATVMTGNETLPVDTNLGSGLNPLTESVTVAQLTASGGAYNIGNLTGNITLSWMNGNFQYGVATANFTLVNPTVVNPGGRIKLKVTQDSTGSRVVTYGNMFLFNGGTPTANSVLTTAANSVDIIDMIYDSATAKIYCTLFKAYA